MEIPVPSKLESFIIVDMSHSTQHKIVGSLRCDCGMNSFRVNQYGFVKSGFLSSETLLPKPSIDGDVIAIQVVCTSCGKGIDVFNSLTDGYDAIVDKRVVVSSIKDSMNTFICKKCKCDRLSLSLSIESTGKEDLLEDGVSETLWMNAFSWIWINLHCLDCGKEYKNYVDFETS